MILLLVVAPVLAWLCVVDARTGRLPNAVTVPAAVLALVCSTGSAACGAFGALLGAAGWTAVNLITFCARGMGAGDVKLAVSLGALVGWTAGRAGAAPIVVPVVALVAAILLAQVLTVAWAAAVRSPRCPHGPPMCAAAALVTVLSS
ncbi:A24 family peptidase [Tsukamurella soli]|uniref:A24 family peptidase n=1 Tax=Tsukamurella soli TaxID=644556 RepID=A0ABP8K9W2_9ACTN